MQANNSAAMHEALEEVNKAYIEGFMGGCGNYPSPEILERVHMVMNKVKAALSAPPRNCDVGTAEEQAERYHAIGEVYHTLTLTNALEWSQMPYEAEEGGEA